MHVPAADRSHRFLILLLRITHAIFNRQVVRRTIILTAQFERITKNERKMKIVFHFRNFPKERTKKGEKEEKNSPCKWDIWTVGRAFPPRVPESFLSAPRSPACRRPFWATSRRPRPARSGREGSSSPVQASPPPNLGRFARACGACWARSAISPLPEGRLSPSAPSASRPCEARPHRPRNTVPAQTRPRRPRRPPDPRPPPPGDSIHCCHRPTNDCSTTSPNLRLRDLS